MKNINFTKAYFVTPRAYESIDDKNDNYSLLEQKELMERCCRHAEIWKDLADGKTKNQTLITVCESVNDALIDIKLKTNSVSEQGVLISGSLHLVGAALSILDPSLSKN